MSSWERVVGADVRRRLRQGLPISRAALREVVRRVPDEITLGVPYLLRPTERADVHARVPDEGLTAVRARTLLRALRTTASGTYQVALFDLNDSDDSDEEEDAPPPPRSGRRGGRSRRSSNRRR